MANFTPVSAAIGGALIGLAATLLMLFTGRVAGISGILAGCLDFGAADRVGVSHSSSGWCWHRWSVVLSATRTRQRERERAADLRAVRRSTKQDNWSTALITTEASSVSLVKLNGFYDLTCRPREHRDTQGWHPRPLGKIRFAASPCAWKPSPPAAPPAILAVQTGHRYHASAGLS